MPPTDKFNLNIPYKTVPDSDPQFTVKHNENMKAIERWARRRRPTPSGGITDWAIANRDTTLTVAHDDVVLCPFEEIWSTAGTAVTWNGAAEFDLSVDGLYLLTFYMAWVSNGSAGYRSCQMWADPVISDHLHGDFDDVRIAQTDAVTIVGFSVVAMLPAGTNITCKLYQNSGSDATASNKNTAGVVLLASI